MPLFHENRCLTGNVSDVFQDEFLVGNSSLLHRFYVILSTHCFCLDNVIRRSLILVYLLKLFWHLASFLPKVILSTNRHKIAITVLSTAIIIIILLSETFRFLQNICFGCISIKASLFYFVLSYRRPIWYLFIPETITNHSLSPNQDKLHYRIFHVWVWHLFPFLERTFYHRVEFVRKYLSFIQLKEVESNLSSANYRV